MISFVHAVPTFRQPHLTSHWIAAKPEKLQVTIGWYVSTLPRARSRMKWNIEGQSGPVL